jgi:hypothetical protein
MKHGKRGWTSATSKPRQRVDGKDFAMAANETFLKSMKIKVTTWKADVDRLQAKANRIDNIDMGQYSACIQEMLAKIQQVENQFTADGGGRIDTWQALRKQTAAVGKEIDTLIEQTRQRFGV